MVERAEVSCAEPAVFGERLCRGFGVLVVAGEDALALHLKLARDMLGVRRGDTHLQALDGLAATLRFVASHMP